VLHQALATGISRGFMVAAGIAVLALVVVVAMIRVRREDLAGAGAPAVAPAPAAPEATAEWDEELDGLAGELGGLAGAPARE
jgi:hypothetical protein